MRKDGRGEVYLSGDVILTARPYPLRFTFYISRFWLRLLGGAVDVGLAFFPGQAVEPHEALLQFAAYGHRPYVVYEPCLAVLVEHYGLVAGAEGGRFGGFGLEDGVL